MGLIGLPHRVRVINDAGLDEWGILKQGTETTEYAGRVRYEVENRVAGKTTGQPVSNTVPNGSMILELAASFDHDSTLEFTGRDGQPIRIRPNSIKSINDFNAKPMYWKVTF